jgi:hypothetical protein
MNEGGSGVFKVQPTQKFEQTSGIQNKPVRMEFIGERKGGVTYFGKDGRQYVGGDNPNDKYADVYPADVNKLELTTVWKVIHVEPERVPDEIIEPLDMTQFEIPTTAMPITETALGPMDMFPKPEHMAIATEPEHENGKTKVKRTRKTKKNAVTS